MNGQDYAREAETLRQQSQKVVREHDGGSREAALLLQEAQVCATLSLTYAIVQASASTHRDEKEWIDATDVSLDAPGQVEPEPAGIRVCDLSLNMKVTHPDVHDGRPVRIVDVGVSEDFDGHCKVMYEDPTLIGPVMVRHLPADTLVTPYGGAQ
jgi:hypothetical protein